MNAEQQRKLEVIRARFKGGYYITERDDLGFEHDIECDVATEDITALLKIIDQQQAIVDAARRVRARVEHETRKYDRDHIIDGSPEWDDMCVALDAHGQPGQSGLAE